MKAIILTEQGGFENLSITEADKPALKPADVLVKVHAISINPVDIKTRKGGALYASMKEDAPVILGWDISGVITKVGDEVKSFKEGDAVFGMVNFPGHGKAYAEICCCASGPSCLKTRKYFSCRSCRNNISSIDCLAGVGARSKSHQRTTFIDACCSGRRGTFCCTNCKASGYDCHWHCICCK
ncbi:MAG TPA: alcohol dehydrogenase catalytic domain-containing protein [Flavisolibacter sp.]